MNAQDLMRRYAMADHVENGVFLERHYPAEGPGRAASGSIYYYVAPGESTEFHKIDCDEYWCYHEGSPLEVWLIGPDGTVTVRMLGAEADCEPTVYIKQGTIFASRSPADSRDGTFLTCITVPRFSYEGFTMVSQAEILRDFPAAAGFFTAPAARAPIVIEGAMDMEVSALVSALDNPVKRELGGYPITEGTLEGYPVVIARTKIGMVNAAVLTAALIDAFAPRCILSQGTAGAHLEEMHPGDIVLGSGTVNINCAHMAPDDCRAIEAMSRGEWVEQWVVPGDPELLALAEKTPYTRGNLLPGIIGSGDYWSHGNQEIHRIQTRYQTLCEEMETWAAARVCQQASLPFLGIRVISNNELTGEAFDPDTPIACQNFTLTLAREIIRLSALQGE